MVIFVEPFHSVTRKWLYINEKVEWLWSGTKSKGVAAMGHTKLGQAKMARDTANSICTLKLSLAYNCLTHFLHQQTIPIIYSPPSCLLNVVCTLYLNDFITFLVQLHHATVSFNWVLNLQNRMDAQHVL